MKVENKYWTSLILYLDLEIVLAKSKAISTLLLFRLIIIVQNHVADRPFTVLKLNFNMMKSIVVGNFCTVSN